MQLPGTDGALRRSLVGDPSADGRGCGAGDGGEVAGDGDEMLDIEEETARGAREGIGEVR